jgi:hypothetical protein
MQKDHGGAAAQASKADARSIRPSAECVDPSDTSTGAYFICAVVILFIVALGLPWLSQDGERFANCTKK